MKKHPFFSPEIVSFRFGRDNEFLLEHWVKGFRCWRRTLTDDEVRGVCFNHEMLNSTGEDLSEGLSERIAVLHVLEKNAVSQISLLQQLRDLLLTIPESIRRLAAPWGRFQYTALEAMRNVPGFDDFLEQEQNGVGYSFVQAVWQLAEVQGLPRLFRTELACKMMIVPRIDLLESLVEVPIPSSFFKLIRRLTPEKPSRDLLWRLIEQVQKPRRTQAMTMLPYLTSTLIQNMDRLPDWIISPGLVAVLSHILDQGSPMDAIIPPAILAAPVEVRHRLARSLSKIKTAEELENRMRHWSNRLYDETIFPAPPMEGSMLLVPLRTGQMLRQEGKLMHNCVAGYARSVANGQNYFYAWMGSERATVLLSRKNGESWILQEYLGFSNSILNEKEKNSIVLELASCFCSSLGLFICRCHIAGIPYYNYDEAEEHFFEDMPLKLRREPSNPYDNRAIEILTLDEAKLGYVPRQHNHKPAEWLDRKLPVSGHLVRESGQWKMEIRVSPPESQA
ncbi:putative HIRAN domain-containing protein [Gammaproteobacteria bacterium]